MTPVILITGGSRGIGAAICRHAADLGYDVAFTYRAATVEAEALADQIRAKGRRVLAVQADAADHEATRAVFRQIDAEFGRLDAFVYNAGITGKTSRLESSTDDNIVEVLTVNTIAALIYTREAILRMSNKHGGDGGSIVLISSTAYETGSAGNAVWYAASKGGINSMTIGLSRELGQDGIRVNAIAPGPINTGISSPEQMKVYVESTSLKRMADPHEVATVAMFLCSEGASFTTGAIVKVAGGR